MWVISKARAPRREQYKICPNGIRTRDPKDCESYALPPELSRGWGFIQLYVLYILETNL